MVIWSFLENLSFYLTIGPKIRHIWLLAMNITLDVDMATDVKSIHKTLQNFFFTTICSQDPMLSCLPYF